MLTIVQANFDRATFCKQKNVCLRDSNFIPWLMTILVLIGTMFDNLSYVPWQDIFKLSASAVPSEFCQWIQVGIDVYISHHKYQVKPYSSPWFSVACAAAVVHRSQFFGLYEQNKSSGSKGKFRQASNCCKRLLEAVKLTRG